VVQPGVLDGLLDRCPHPPREERDRFHRHIGVQFYPPAGFVLHEIEPQGAYLQAGPFLVRRFGVAVAMAMRRRAFEFAVPNGLVMRLSEPASRLIAHARAQHDRIQPVG
jgi:hypothetical protein